MFILRSAFWLTLAFFVMAPQHVDIGSAAGDMSSRAMAAGRDFVVTQALAASCEGGHCFGGDLLAAALAAPAAAPVSAIPLPRPRPGWLG